MRNDEDRYYDADDVVRSPNSRVTWISQPHGSVYPAPSSRQSFAQTQDGTHTRRPSVSQANGGRTRVEDIPELPPPPRIHVEVQPPTPPLGRETRGIQPLKRRPAVLRMFSRGRRAGEDNIDPTVIGPAEESPPPPRELQYTDPEDVLDPSEFHHRAREDPNFEYNVHDLQSQTQQEERPKRRGLGRLMSFKGRDREPLTPDEHPLPPGFIRPYLDADEHRREIVMEPYMDAQASVAGSRRGSPGPSEDGRDEPSVRIPEPDYFAETHRQNPRRPPWRFPYRRHRDPEQNPDIVDTQEGEEDGVPSQPLASLIPPPPEPTGREEDYYQRDRFRVPLPGAWNVFGGVKKLPIWGRRQQNVQPTPFEEGPSQPPAEPRAEPIVQTGSQSESDETLTEHSPIPPELQPMSPQPEAGPSRNPMDPPVKPRRRTVPDPGPSPVLSRQQSIVPVKQIPPSASRHSRDNSRTDESPGFDRSLSTVDLPPEPRFKPFRQHIDKLIDNINAIKELPWMAERVTVDYVPPESKPRRESQVREYLAPAPPEPKSWYQYREGQRKPRKYRERLVTMMLPLTSRGEPQHTLYLSDTSPTESDAEPSPTLHDHGNITIVPVHTRKGTVRHIAVPRPMNTPRPVHVVQAAYPPNTSVMSPVSPGSRSFHSSSYHHHQQPVITNVMIAPDGRVLERVPPSTHFVVPHRTPRKSSNPMPSPPTFVENSVLYSPRHVRLRYEDDR